MWRPLHCCQIWTQLSSQLLLLYPNIINHKLPGRARHASWTSQDRFWADMSDSSLHQHHQNAKWKSLDSLPGSMNGEQWSHLRVLKSKYSSPQSHFVSYLQIRHAIRKTCILQMCLSWKTFLNKKDWLLVWFWIEFIPLTTSKCSISYRKKNTSYSSCNADRETV